MDTTLDEQDRKTAQAVQQATDVMRRGDLPGARRIARAALDDGLEHPFLIKVEALWLQHAGELQESLRLFHHARTLDESDPMILNSIAGIMGMMGEPQGALKILEASAALAPDMVTTHYLFGWTYEALRDYRAARLAYQKTVLLAPGHVQAHAGLATVSVRLQDYPAARAAAAKALALAPGEATATVALGMADLGEGLPSQAEARVRPLTLSSAMTPLAKAIAFGVLGDALDAQDRTNHAFDAYAAENALLREMHQAKRPRAQEAQENLQRLADVLAALPDSQPKAAEAVSMPARQHVFLLGFMRSGTTLLEQVLASHPDVTTLEETDLLGEAAVTYLMSPEGLAKLAAASAQELDALREAYWQGVAAKGCDVAGKVFIDKQPLHTAKLPLIARLFPGARILFAVRDPRDVVFSCFRRHLDVGAVTYAFLDLESAARLYDVTMTIGAWSLDNLPLNALLVRHEALVEDFEAQAKTVCGFIGLQWDDSLRDFAARVAQRQIASLSGPQISKGLNREGVGRWRAYADKLEPIAPLLAPWVRHFGYAER
jgi:tetratricopeptide (TPR) repeat protein